MSLEIAKIQFSSSDDTNSSVPKIYTTDKVTLISGDPVEKYYDEMYIGNENLVTNLFLGQKEFEDSRLDEGRLTRQKTGIYEEWELSFVHNESVAKFLGKSRNFSNVSFVSKLGENINPIDVEFTSVPFNEGRHLQRITLKYKLNYRTSDKETKNFEKQSESFIKIGYLGIGGVYTLGLKFEHTNPSFNTPLSTGYPIDYIILDASDTPAMTYPYFITSEQAGTPKESGTFTIDNVLNTQSGLASLNTYYIYLDASKVKYIKNATFSASTNLDFSVSVVDSGGYYSGLLNVTCDLSNSSFIELSLLSGINQIESISYRNNTSNTDYDHYNSTIVDNVDLDFYNNGFTLGAITAIINYYFGIGALNGTLDVSGAGNASVPSGTTLTRINDMINNKGWTISYNT